MDELTELTEAKETEASAVEATAAVAHIGEAVVEEASAEESASETPTADDPPAEEAQSESSPEDEISRLRGELDELRTKLSEREAAFERMSVECAEFSELYPDRPLNSVPSEVWDSVRAGIPLAAAFSYYEVRRAHREAQAGIVNDNNRISSAGSVSKSQPDYFSPGEVRAMSAAEVRTNYQKIIASMKMWH